MQKDWFKLKRYPHIGFPIEPKERHTWIEKYVSDQNAMKKHSFLPFIHKTSKVRKFRKKYSPIDGTPIRNEDSKVLRHASVKDRELYYASHIDSLIYSYYAEKISSLYEEELEKRNLLQIVTAYRTIPVDSKKPFGAKKCNIDFAADIFAKIQQFNSSHFVVITFDIEKFFDTLDHAMLREKWISLLDDKATKLPDDHFNVFKHVTRFSYVDLVDIFKLYQNRIFVKSTEYKKPVIRRKRVSKIKYLKKQNAVSFCTKKEFLNCKSLLVKKKKLIRDEEGNVIVRGFGIPQGSPISAILANLYMLGFDEKVNNCIKGNGIYRRYSDDMIVVCPLEEKDNVIQLFKQEIERINLEIQASKTQVFHFKKVCGVLKCGQEFQDSINYNKSLNYLGFEFDGRCVKLKSGCVSKFYRKMKRSIKRAKHYANNEHSKTYKEIFKSRILKRFSYKGENRRRKYLWDHKSKCFKRSEHYDWGNFLSYAKKARTMKVENKIRSQTRRHWTKLNNLLKP